jgi:hypothetical protein
MEILNQPLPEQKEPIGNPEPKTEAGMPLKYAEFLSHLDLKDKIFDDVIMGKISFIADKIDIEKFRDLSLKVGNDGMMSKLDKIYTYMQLSDEYNKLKERGDLIKETLNQYE